MCVFFSAIPQDAVPVPPPTVSPLSTSPKPIVNVDIQCNFENASRPICDLKQDTGDNVGTWARVNASDPPSSNHPISDHTVRNSSGHYIAALRHTNDDSKGEVTARLKTPTLDPNLDYCLTFFLHHVGDSPPPVVVNAEVTTSRCPRKDDLSCSFTEGLCGFRQEEVYDNIDWIWHDANGHDDPYLPDESKAHDYYVYLNTSAPKGSKGVLYTTNYWLTEPHCLTFQVHMHSEMGQDAALNVLNIGEGNIKDGELLLHAREDFGSDWVTLQLNLEPSLKPFHLAFEGIMGNHMNGVYSTFALDDVKLTPGMCNSPASCSFDSNLCSWYSNENLGDDEWQFAGPGEVSINTRPYSDSTQRDNLGGFVFIEADENLSNNRAWLMSERLPPIVSAERCLTFWYHLYGAEGTKLSALMYDPNSGSLTTLWKLSPSTPIWDPGWQYAAAPFSASYIHQVIMESVMGTGFMGDVAVDDIVVAADGCIIQPSEANNGVNYTTPVIPTSEPATSVPPGLYDCYFDEDLCIWKSEAGSVWCEVLIWQDFAWNR
ncbi:MAM and LDL-receptor class A domain-containing protein 1-like [Homarus americanus]|uniref:MAM and LDL-receptor class A domain-containing protein 1-like n=1 Tax=Homarus americanus TaxID=6706 RepID=UPI001C460366|nr:MAM and LDL-receptor class A domain-containing protein 1-like [Homarus americanus]